MENMRVVTVCGKELTIWSSPDEKNRRKVLRTRTFNNRGQALDFANMFQEAEKNLAEYQRG